jgi:hypothetical protein
VGSADAPGPEALVESLSGTTWTATLLTPPAGESYAGLTDITCAAATVPSCQAVGTAEGQGGEGGVAMTATLSGSTWTTAVGYAGGDLSALTGVACATATSCVALGSDGSSQPVAPLALALNAGSWTSVGVTLPAGSVRGALEHASCPTSCTGVGADIQPWPTLPGYNATFPMVAIDS